MQREVPMNKFARIALAVAIAASAGCAVGPDYKEPKTELPPAFSAADAASDAPYDKNAPVAQFWTVFDDATLTELVVRSLNFNHDLRIALANINQARALRRESQFDQFP